ncbi:MAG: prolyl oligopeptidase family serine peptidase [Acidobacteria bacterium]|nr:prolyl oligopeptidase family serine peptidase [Acidobacteriota bacterium]
MQIHPSLRAVAVLFVAAFLPWASGASPGDAPAAAAPPQPTAIQVFHRSGQTFVTWDERADLPGEHYRVYRHTQPVNAGNLSQATRLCEVAEGSSRFFAGRYADDGGVWRYRYFERLVVQDGGSPLPDGRGLFVWTLHRADFGGGSSGNAWYAVTTVTTAQGENVVDFSAANTAGPTAEQLGDPLPVETAVNVGPGGKLFLQYMDVSAWNPTFHAPHPGNAYYGLDPDAPGVPGAFQYAYDYAVYEPDLYCGGTVPARAPVLLILHGWEGNGYDPLTECPDAAWCAFKIYPFDQSETWFLGFAKHHDFRSGDPVPAGDTVGNFTERRLLRMVYDLLRHPEWGPRIDPQRIYVYGHSMGGSGTLALALRYPNVFAAAYASEPMTNYRTSGDGGGIDWRTDTEPKWGTVALNLPVEIDGPGGWADPLKAWNGTGVWDWQNHQATLTLRRGDEMVPFGVAHGRNDTAIEWPTQGSPAYAAFDAGLRCWGGAVTDDDHTWLAFQGLPPNLSIDPEVVPFYRFGVIRDETVPGLSAASDNLAFPPAGPGLVNASVEWSASWDPWDGPPLDADTQWVMSFRTVNGATVTVNVTPRRLRSFATDFGTLSWENRVCGSCDLVASGTVLPDIDGLVTVPSFQVTPGGNRLILRRVGAGRGDLDLSERVDAADRVILVNFLAAQLVQGTPPFTAPLAAADLDRDGAVTAVDDVLLSRKLTQ